MRMLVTSNRAEKSAEKKAAKGKDKNIPQYIAS